MMARRDRHDLKPATALSVMLAVLIAIAAAMLLVHWMACSQARELRMTGTCCHSCPTRSMSFCQEDSLRTMWQLVSNKFGHGG
jgi:hypothetical protein